MRWQVMVTLMVCCLIEQSTSSLLPKWGTVIQKKQEKSMNTFRSAFTSMPVCKFPAPGDGIWKRGIFGPDRFLAYSKSEEVPKPAAALSGLTFLGKLRGLVGKPTSRMELATRASSWLGSYEVPDFVKGLLGKPKAKGGIVGAIASGVMDRTAVDLAKPFGDSLVRFGKNLEMGSIVKTASSLFRKNGFSLGKMIGGNLKSAIRGSMDLQGGILGEMDSNKNGIFGALKSATSGFIKSRRRGTIFGNFNLMKSAMNSVTSVFGRKSSFGLFGMEVAREKNVRSAYTSTEAVKNLANDLTKLENDMQDQFEKLFDQLDEFKEEVKEEMTQFKHEVVARTGLQYYKAAKSCVNILTDHYTNVLEAEEDTIEQSEDEFYQRCKAEDPYKKLSDALGELSDESDLTGVVKSLAMAFSASQVRTFQMDVFQIIQGGVEMYMLCSYGDDPDKNSEEAKAYRKFVRGQAAQLLDKATDTFIRMEEIAFYKAFMKYKAVVELGVVRFKPHNGTTSCKEIKPTISIQFGDLPEATNKVHINCHPNDNMLYNARLDDGWYSLLKRPRFGSLNGPSTIVVDASTHPIFYSQLKSGKIPRALLNASKPVKLEVDDELDGYNFNKFDSEDSLTRLEKYEGMDKPLSFSLVAKLPEEKLDLRVDVTISIRLSNLPTDWNKPDFSVILQEIADANNIDQVASGEIDSMDHNGEEDEETKSVIIIALGVVCGVIFLAFAAIAVLFGMMVYRNKQERGELGLGLPVKKTDEEEEEQPVGRPARGGGSLGSTPRRKTSGDVRPSVVSLGGYGAAGSLGGKPSTPSVSKQRKSSAVSGGSESGGKKKKRVRVKVRKRKEQEEV